jgi:hypothetical protein
MSDDAATPQSELSPELQAAADQFYGDLTQPEPGSDEATISPDGGEGAGSDSSGSGESDPQPSPTLEEWAWDDGFKISKDQARSYAELESFLYANPDKAEALAKFLRGDSATIESSETTPSGSTTSTPQISIDDITDPEVRIVFERVQAQEQELQRLREIASGTNEYITTQQEETAQSLMTRATTSFQKEYSLSDTEMEQISNAAARLQVLPALMSPIDPISGQARRVDPLAAIEEALSIAYWQIPEFRNRAISSEIDNSTKDKARKQKLSSLQGSSGSVPREQSVADTPQGRREQMIAEVAGLLGKGNN